MASVEIRSEDFVSHMRCELEQACYDSSYEIAEFIYEVLIEMKILRRPIPTRVYGNAVVTGNGEV